MQQRILILLSSFIIISVCGYSQTKLKREKFWSVGFNAGIIGHSKTSLQTTSNNYFTRTVNFGAGSLSDNNGGTKVSIIANTSIGLHAGLVWKDLQTKNYTGIYFEFQKNKACYSFNEPFHYGFKGDTNKVWVDADNYLTASIGLMRTWHFLKDLANSNSCWYIKGSLGQTFNHTNFGTVQNVNYQEDWTENGTGMKLKVLNAAKQSLMLNTELGRKIIFDDNSMLDIGIVYHAPFANTRTVEYEFFTSNVSLGKSQITYYGSTVMLNVSYTLNYKVKEKPIDSTKIRSFDDLAIDSTEIKKHDARFHHHKINGRRFHVQQSITVANDEITVLVWDKNRVDGDEISLYLNGEPILENYTVSKTKKEIKVKLQPGSNVIVMHALNLGRVPPNTAALNVNDGSTKKNITLVSDLHKSGALEIIYNP